MLGYCVPFYPKFHFELNFIQHYWCRAKWPTRESWGYDFEALKATVPEALASVSNASIRGFYRLALLIIILQACNMELKLYINRIAGYKTNQVVGEYAACKKVFSLQMGTGLRNALRKSRKL